MRRLFICLVAASLFHGCGKDNVQTNASECVVRMKKLYDKELKCIQENAMEINLYTGIYKGDLVYFYMTMCPHCNTVPPAYGYTCENKKVLFDNFTDVSDIKEVYNSCTKKFTE